MSSGRHSSWVPGGSFILNERRLRQRRQISVRFECGSELTIEWIQENLERYRHGVYVL